MNRKTKLLIFFAVLILVLSGTWNYPLADDDDYKKRVGAIKFWTGTMTIMTIINTVKETAKDAVTMTMMEVI